MKLRNKIYMRRKRAIRKMVQFNDLTSFLQAGFELSKSVVVKKDILNTLIDLKHNNYRAAIA